MAREPQPYMQNRELSWLTFNERVLEEARDDSDPPGRAAEICLHLHQQPGRILYDPGGQPLRHGLSWGTTRWTAKHWPAPLRSSWRPSSPPGSPSDRAAGPGLRRSSRPQLRRPTASAELSLGQLAGKEQRLSQAPTSRPSVLPILSPQIVDIHHPFPHLPEQERPCGRPASMGQDRRVSSASSLCLPPPPTLSILPGEGLRYVRTEQHASG